MIGLFFEILTWRRLSLHDKQEVILNANEPGLL